MFTRKSELPQVQKRIADGKIRYSDIKYQDRLTQEQIASIPEDLVYGYVQNKLWTLKDFRRWLDSFSEEVE